MGVLDRKNAHISAHSIFRTCRGLFEKAYFAEAVLEKPGEDIHCHPGKKRGFLSLIHPVKNPVSSPRGIFRGKMTTNTPGFSPRPFQETKKVSRSLLFREHKNISIDDHGIPRVFPKNTKRLPVRTAFVSVSILSGSPLVFGVLFVEPGLVDVHALVGRVHGFADLLGIVDVAGTGSKACEAEAQAA